MGSKNKFGIAFISALLLLFVQAMPLASAAPGMYCVTTHTNPSWQ